MSIALKRGARRLTIQFQDTQKQLVTCCLLTTTQMLLKSMDLEELYWRNKLKSNYKKNSESLPYLQTPTDNSRNRNYSENKNTRSIELISYDHSDICYS